MSADETLDDAVTVGSEFTSSVSGGTPGYSYSWSADGNSYTTQDINVSFSNSGSYSISLTVKDAAGESVTQSLTETVSFRYAEDVWPSTSVTVSFISYVPDDEKVYDNWTPEPSDAPLTYQAYVIVPVPPDSDELNVTEFPASVGFCDEEIEIVGLGFTVIETDAEAVCPTPSVTVTVTV